MPRVKESPHIPLSRLKITQLSRCDTARGNQLLPGTCRQISGTLVPAWQRSQGTPLGIQKHKRNTLNKLTICDFGATARFHTFDTASFTTYERQRETFKIRLFPLEICLLYTYIYAFSTYYVHYTVVDVFILNQCDNQEQPLQMVINVYTDM